MTIDEIIAKMPKRVRDEVARLNAEIAALEQRLKSRADSTSRVRIYKYGDPAESLPDDTTMRFCADETPDSDKYIEVLWERNRGKDGKTFPSQWLYLRCGFGQLLVKPHSSNGLHVRAAGFDKDGEPKL